MLIQGLQKLTLLDFPGKTAATVFTAGCNFCCPFCHNAALVLKTPAAPMQDTLSLDNFFSFLKKRRNLLDGVCITGGEPLMQPDIADFCARIHNLGFSVKIDTNGSFPDRLNALIKANLIDYIALDVKNTPERYAETIGIPDFDISRVRLSMDILQRETVPFEFRTTVVRELHTANDLLALACWIGSTPAWFLQSYRDTENVIAGAGALHAWDPDNLHALLPKLQAIVPAVSLRGINSVN